MTSINSLFDWLLEPIFQQLSRQDRLTCKLVCQRWYRVLMESWIFRADRRIILQECKINVNQEPASIFMNAVFPYEIQSLGRYKHVGSAVKFESQQDLNQFAQHLGSSVTEMMLNDFRRNLTIKSLEAFTNLEKLFIHYDRNYDDTNRCKFGHDAVTLTNLKELCLHSKDVIQFHCPECIVAQFHSFKNLTKLDVETYYLDSSIDGEMINFDDKIFNKLNEPRFALEEIKISIRDMTLTVNVMVKLLKVLPNLRSVTVKAYDALTFIPSFQSVTSTIILALKQLTHLSFECYGKSNMKPSAIPFITKQLETCGYPVPDLPILMSSVQNLDDLNYFKLDINHDDKTSIYKIGIDYDYSFDDDDDDYDNFHDYDFDCDSELYYGDEYL